MAFRCLTQATRNRVFQRAPAVIQSGVRRRIVPAFCALKGQGIVRRSLLTAAVLSVAVVAYKRRNEGTSTGAAQHDKGQQRRKLMNILLDSAESHQDLSQQLRREGRLGEERVRDAFTAVDRRHFVAPGTPSYMIYQDSPLPIGNEQTISAPHMHAACLDLLGPQLQPGANALDVGSGSGYLTAVMGRMVSPGGRVVGVEKWPDLAARSVESIKKAEPGLLEDGTIRIMAGNALGNILDDDATQYDAIHVGAAAATMPENLVKKLAPGGRMVRLCNCMPYQSTTPALTHLTIQIIPVGGQHDFQTLRCVDKSPKGNVTQEDLMYVRYVPLTKPEAAET